MAQTVKTVNFTSRKSGLSTVGYTLYNTDGTEKLARTTTGVAEIKADTGIYFCYITFDSGWQGTILWDTGGGTPAYAVDSYRDQDTTIVNSIWDEAAADHSTANSMGQRLNRIHKEALSSGFTSGGGAFASIITKEDRDQILKTLSLLNKFLTSPTASKKLPELMEQQATKLNLIESSIQDVIEKSKISQALIDNIITDLTKENELIEATGNETVKKIIEKFSEVSSQTKTLNERFKSTTNLLFEEKITSQIELTNHLKLLEQALNSNQAETNKTIEKLHVSTNDKFSDHIALLEKEKKNLAIELQENLTKEFSYLFAAIAKSIPTKQLQQFITEGEKNG